MERIKRAHVGRHSELAESIIRVTEYAIRLPVFFTPMQLLV
jgi:hypothetical protein